MSSMGAHTTCCTDLRQPDTPLKGILSATNRILLSVRSSEAGARRVGDLLADRLRRSGFTVSTDANAGYDARLNISYGEMPYREPYTLMLQRSQRVAVLQVESLVAKSVEFSYELIHPTIGLLARDTLRLDPDPKVMGDSFLEENWARDEFETKHLSRVSNAIVHALR